MSRVIHQREGIGATACIIQRGAPRLSGITIEHPTLVVVRKGFKRLSWNGQEHVIREGEAVAVAAGQVFDIVNLLSAAGEYEATWLAWHPDLVADQRPRAGSTLIRGLLPLGRLEPAFDASLEQARAALATTDGIPDEIARHRLSETLLWLGMCGGHFGQAQVNSLSARVRSLLTSAPDQPWAAPDVASRCAMSEATLRRRLASEGHSLTGLLTDVRMSLALNLLQSTDRPINQIALDAGYESASRFTARFRSRFGFSPTVLRGQQRGRETSRPNRIDRML